jgi:hypothetical protein
MGYVVREQSQGDLGGSGKNKGNNWHKDPKSIKEGKEGGKKDANVKKRKPYASGGMKNRDGERTDD